MNQLGKSLFGPAPRGWIEFVGEDAHSDGDGDALGVEVAELTPILPIKPSSRQRGIRQPGNRNVVEDVVAGEAFGFSFKGTGDQFIATGIVIEEVRRQPDGRVRDSV